MVDSPGKEGENRPQMRLGQNLGAVHLYDMKQNLYLWTLSPTPCTLYTRRRFRKCIGDFEVVGTCARLILPHNCVSLQRALRSRAVNNYLGDVNWMMFVLFILAVVWVEASAARVWSCDILKELRLFFHVEVLASVRGVFADVCSIVRWTFTRLRC